jgi:hypothetical protein
MCAGGIRTHIPRIQAPISCLCPMSFANKSVGFPVPLKLRSFWGSGCTSWRRQEVQLSTSSNLPDHPFLLIYNTVKSSGRYFVWINSINETCNNSWRLHGRWKGRHHQTSLPTKIQTIGIRGDPKADPTQHRTTHIRNGTKHEWTFANWMAGSDEWTIHSS